MRALEKGIKPVPRDEERRGVPECRYQGRDEEEVPRPPLRLARFASPTASRLPMRTPSRWEVDAEGRHARGGPGSGWQALPQVEDCQGAEEGLKGREAAGEGLEEPIRGLVDYPDSEDEAETTEVPAEMPVKVYGIQVSQAERQAE